MGREYRIECVPPRGEDLAHLLNRLPSPINRNPLAEIYNYRIEEDGIYFVDNLVAKDVAAIALKALIDSALATNERVTLYEP